jgi:nardilysin
LLDIITKDLKKIAELMEPTVFEAYRKQYKKYCYNNLINSKFLNKDSRLNILEEHHKFLFERYLEADKITFEDLVTFSTEFLKKLKIQILVQGNIAKSEAVKISNCVLTNLNSSQISSHTTLESRARKLPSGSNVVFVKSMLPDDKNSTTTNYIQIGPSSIRLQCLIEFTEKIMEEPLFDVLRTQEQLGYSVSCSHRFNHGILGMSITVQSQENKNPTSIVYERIEKFVHENMLKIIEKMNDDDFLRIQNALIKLKNMVDVELENEVGRNWSEITSNEFIFNRMELEAQMIAQLTKEDILEFYQTKVIASDARKLSIQIIGNTQEEITTVQENHTPKLEILKDRKPAEGQQVIVDMESFKNTLKMYPVTKTAIDV